MNLPLHTIDIANRRFGLWTAVRYSRPKPQGALWLCRCDCGTEREIISSALRRGKSTSCGCITSALIAKSKTVNFACSVDGCGRSADSKQLCDKHYRRFKKYGSTDKRRRFSTIPTRIRLDRASVMRESGCREWIRGLSSDGYGQFKFNNKGIPAHRAAWIDAHGEIPAGLFVCHTCDNPKCIELSHLWLGTALDNRRDCIAKGRARGPGGVNHWNYKDGQYVGRKSKAA